MKTPVHPRRFLQITAGRNEKAIKRMKHEFAKLADAKNMAERFNPIRREMLNSGQMGNEWDKYANPMITLNEARTMAGYPERKVILYADNKAYEYDSGADMWKCRYCGEIRVGERCKGCGAPRTQEG